MSDRAARVNMSFEGNTAGETLVGPEEVLAPYVRGGYMEWLDNAPSEPAVEAVAAPEPKKATRGKAGA